MRTRIFVIAVMVAMAVFAQENKMDMEPLEAKQLYDAFKQNAAEPYMGKQQITGIATYVGPDVYGLPSVELSESRDASGRVLCVLPFSDYLKLRKVKKGMTLTMEGNVLGFAEQYDIVVVKQCKIVGE